MTAMPRLITRTDALTRLLSAIVAVPDGVKLSIPQLRDALVSQADVLAGIETLVAAGEIEAATLRPAVKVAEPCPETSLVTGAALADELVSYAERHRLAAWRVAQHLFGGRNGISRLRRSAHPHKATILKVRAFLAAPPPPGFERQAAGGPRVADVGGVSGEALAVELDALIADHGLSKGAVGRLLYGQSSGVETLRKSSPRRATVAKVRALLAEVERWIAGGCPEATSPIDQLKRGGSLRRVTKPARPAGVELPPPAVAVRKQPSTGPLPTSLKPGDVAWCGQCEQRVGAAKAAKCPSRWCSLKEQAA